jgi:signal transduction histidine kinase
MKKTRGKKSRATVPLRIIIMMMIILMMIMTVISKTMMLNVQDGDDDGDRGLLHSQDQQVPVRAEP